MSANEGHLKQTLNRLESIQEEERPHRRLFWREGDSRQATFRAAWRSALMGALPVLLLVAVLSRYLPLANLFVVRIANVAMLVGGGVLYVLAVGVVSGRVAHRFAYETDISAPTLAKLVAWVGNLSLWGWVALLVFFILAHP